MPKNRLVPDRVVIADLRRAATERLGAARGGHDRDFLDRIDARPDDGEESVGALQRVVLNVHTVERHVDRLCGMPLTLELRVVSGVITPGKKTMNCEASRLASGMF